jgi:membrane protein DedA with SNARE-associated domain
MVSDVLFYLNQYGYLAVFLLVFLQEIGAPNPIPNEFLLLTAGYLSFKGILQLPFVIGCALGGDLLAGTFLFLAFYFFGNVISKRKPSWLRISVKRQERIKNQIEKIRGKGSNAIFFGRLTPFVRGYVAVVSGLLRFSPEKYFPILIFSSSIWSFFYVVTGYFLATYWDTGIEYVEVFNYLFLIILIVAFIVLLTKLMFKKSSLV